LFVQIAVVISDTFLMIKQEETWLCNSLSIDFKEIDDKRS
jgi:hypothetical protein